MSEETVSEELETGIKVDRDLIEKYRDKIRTKEDFEKLRSQLPAATFQRVKNLIERYDTLEDILNSREFSEISKIELKYLVSLYTEEPAEFVLEANSLREQYEIMLKTLFRELGNQELQE